MTEFEPTSESEVDYPKGVTDEVTCLDYLKKKEVFLYKMMNDPSHKAMLYFLEVLMNSEAPVTVEQLAARFSHKTFSPEMREACGGGSPEGLREFLLRYPSLFNVGANGHVNSVTIELPEIDGLPDGLSDVDCWSNDQASLRNNSSALNGKENSHMTTKRVNKTPSVSSLSLMSNASTSSGSYHINNRVKKPGGTTGSSMNPIENGSSLSKEQTTPRGCMLYPTDQACCAKLPVAHVQAYPCVHCPLVEMTCLHHLSSCSGDHHHHHATTTTHCICANSRLSCVPACHQCPSLQVQANQNKSKDTLTSVCALPPLERLTLETEAVRFFQQRLLKKEERWIQIKSLAGHLSQASAEIRAVVGPQLEFRNFLLRHPHVFEVQGELVSVRDPFGSLYPTRKDNVFHNSHSSTNLLTQGVPAASGFFRQNRHHRPKSLVLPNNKSAFFTPSLRALNQTMDLEEACKDQAFHGRSCMNLAESTPTIPQTPTGSQPADTALAGQESSMSQCLSDLKLSRISSDNSFFDNAVGQARHANSLSVSMSANEYRSVMFVRKVLDKYGTNSDQAGLPFNELLQILIERAPETVRSTIGWTKIEVEEFLNQHHLFFEMFSTTRDLTSSEKQSAANTSHQETSCLMVRNKRLEKVVNIVITETKHVDSNVRSLTNHCGRIYHVTKLWGIIDLGKHEHVFFDKSIFKHIDDLQKHFKVDELLYFNAILAPKESRAKWRATEVWKECDKKTIENMNRRLKNSESNRSASVQKVCIPLNRSSNMQPADISRQDSSGLDIGFEEYDDEEDTDADGEIEEIDIRSLSLTDHPMEPSTNAARMGENIYDITPTHDQHVESEPMMPTGAFDEEMQLVADIKFIGGESKLDRHLEYKPIRNSVRNSQMRQGDKQRLNPNEHACPGNSIEDESKNQFVSSSTENTPSEYTSSLHSGEHSRDVSSRNDLTRSISSSDSCNNSIAVQTVSTGEIMATNLYHDQKKELCPSEC